MMLLFYITFCFIDLLAVDWLVIGILILIFWILSLGIFRWGGKFYWQQKKKQFLTISPPTAYPHIVFTADTRVGVCTYQIGLFFSAAYFIYDTILTFEI